MGWGMVKNKQDGSDGLTSQTAEASRKLPPPGRRTDTGKEQ